MLVSASRLRQLEEQLRDIEARWSGQQQADVSGTPSSAAEQAAASAEGPGAEHAGTRPSFIVQQAHDAAEDEVTRIQEQARSKSLLALKEELLPRQPPPALAGDPAITYGPLQASPDQRAAASGPTPEVVIVHSPYTAPEAWLPAGSGRKPSSGGVLEATTWEAQKSAALLALEAERRGLQATVERLTGAQAQAHEAALRVVEEHQRELQQLGDRHVAQLQRMAAEHKEQVLQQNLAHQRALADAAGVVGEKLQQLQEAAGQLFERQRAARVQACAFFFWQRLALQSRRLAWAEAVWHRRILDACLTEWLVVTTAIRHRRRAEAEAQEREERRLSSLEARCVTLHSRRVLAAWHTRAAHLAAKHRQQARADRHWRAVLRRAVLGVLADETTLAALQQQGADARVRRVRLVHSFKAWVQLHRLLHLYLRNLVLRALRAWSAITCYYIGLRQRVVAWKAAWEDRRKILLLGLLRDHAVYRRRLRLAAFKVGLGHRLRLAAHCMSELWATRTRARAFRTFRAGRLRRLLQAWHNTLLRAARNRRVLASLAAAKLAQAQRMVFQQWSLLSSASARGRLKADNEAVQSYVGQLQHELRGSEVQRVAAMERSAAVQQENRRLRIEARQNLLMHAPEGFMNRELRWRSLPADPDQAPKLRQRCRHITLMLSGLQGTPVDASAAASQQSLDPSDVPALTSTLVVFGGMGGEDWYADVQVLTISQSAVGNVRTLWQQPLVDVRSGAGDVPAGTLQAFGPPPELPLARDFAGCQCGPNQFLVHGGFDGVRELDAMHVFTMHRLDAAAGVGTSFGSGFGLRNVPPTDFSLSWRAVRPRSPTSPSSRSHHAAAYHASGRTVLVVGGYSSGRGHLSELWAFSFDHMEWWQPETLGDYPGPRRGHIAAVVANKLFVHGGFDGQALLGDMWELDLGSWAWSRLEAKPPHPAARRGHACDVVAGRYLVVHGGYDGARLLADAWAYDTVAGTWSELDASGGADDMPCPRSLHTLTCVGHACVLLGGSSALGALNEVHLLENPAITAGQVQQQQLLEARLATLDAEARATTLAAQLAKATLERDHAQEQLQAVEQRALELAARHNASARAAAELEDALLAAERDAADAAAAQRMLAARAAGLQRRVERARQGGWEVAAGAEAMHEQLCDAQLRVSELERSLEQALSAAHDAQAAALQLAGERQALQLQVASSANEVEVVRRMAAAVEREHTDGERRVRGRVDGEVAALRVRVQELEQQLVASSRNASSEEPGTPYDRNDTSLEKDTGGSLAKRTLRGAELAQFQARALEAETRVEMMHKEYEALMQELANAKHEAAKERAAAAAAARTLADAAEDRQRLEFRYQRSIEQLEQEIRALQRQQWARDFAGTATAAAAAPPRVLSLPQGLPPSSASALVQVLALHTPDATTRPQTAEEALWGAESGAGSAMFPAHSGPPPPGFLDPQDQHRSPRPSSRSVALVRTSRDEAIWAQGYAEGAMPPSPGRRAGGLSTALHNVAVTLSPGVPRTSEPGMPHVTELLRLREALLDGGE